MASIKRKSAAVAIAVVGIAGLSLASAAQLNVNAASLGAGATLVASCDDEVDVDFTSVLDGTEYVVTEAVVSDIDGACMGNTIGITVQGETPAEQSVTGTSATFSLSDIPAEDVEDVAVIIYG